MPFTADQFFEVFAEYNQAFWLSPSCGGSDVLPSSPRHAGPFRCQPFAHALSGSALGPDALAYHAWLFTQINPAAWLLALLFAAQAALLFLAARKRLAYFSDTGPKQVLGLALVSYALAYPFLTLALGHTYPATPTFGVPCSLTCARITCCWRLA